jgi:hypothetical protein
VAQDGKASARQVQTGMSDDKSIEILSGIAPGEPVVVVGQTGLRDGAAIQVVDAPGQGGQQGQRQGQGQGQQGQRQQAQGQP